MANIYLKKNGPYWGLCDENWQMFDNDFCAEAVIKYQSGASPRLIMTFILPDNEHHLCSKFVTIETQKEPVPKKD